MRITFKPSTKLHSARLVTFFVLLCLLAVGCKEDNENPVTPAPATVTDIDGNVYRTVTIGTQVWMAENLKTRRFNDGVPIQLAAESKVWMIVNNSGFYCWYNNDSVTYSNTYGALYNWNAVISGRLAPAGWHVPSDSEWTILMNFLGGESNAGAKMKHAGTSLWESPNTGADNSSGFTGLPAGFRDANGNFDLAGRFGFWWSATPGSSTTAIFRGLNYDNTQATRYTYRKAYGMSIRCVRNN